MDIAKAVRLHLILLAGGKGLRAATSAADTPKQFHPTARGPLYLVCLQEFLKLQNAPDHPLASLTITVPDPWRDQVSRHLQNLEKPEKGLALGIPWVLASAGLTRTESTWSAMGALLGSDHSPQPTDLVAVHDAARPFASAGLLARLSASAFQAQAAVPGIAVPDSLVQVVPQPPQSPQTGEYVDRATIFAVQTPQVFQWDGFLQAHTWAAKNNKNFTDDGSLLAERGTMPQVVPGEISNWKVTTAADSERAVSMLSGHSS